MPRKKEPKSTFWPGTKIPDPELQILLLYSVFGVQAKHASEILKEERGFSISEKTINRYYIMMGERFYAFYEDLHARDNPDYAEFKRSDPEEYARQSKKLIDDLHHDAINYFAPEYRSNHFIDGKPWAVTNQASEYRKMSAQKMGLKGNAKAHLGLLYIREWLQCIDDKIFDIICNRFNISEHECGGHILSLVIQETFRKNLV